jgi:hypothetical protein
MFKSPQQQIFDAVYSISERLGYATFDYLPPSKQSYPFVFVGEQFDQDQRTKTSVYGYVQQSIYIYHDYKKRRELTSMMDELKRELRILKKTDNFYVSCRNINSETRINGQSLSQNSNGQTLLQGFIEVEYRFN